MEKFAFYVILYSIFEQTYGAPYLHLHRADYHSILVNEARRLGVTIKHNSHIEGIDLRS